MIVALLDQLQHHPYIARIGCETYQMRDEVSPGKNAVKVRILLYESRLNWQTVA